MSKIDIEKLIYKKPNLEFGLKSLYSVYNQDVITEPDLPVEPDPEDDSTGTGGN